ncbi:endonuclease domain-containing protein [Metabacillus sp. Hm71]|uniref:endonuclease domain-containing protein n=1 Tax=Metabacillus sp. Hm71 TaxID=3450743 RepID=UPI003F42052C
MNGYISIAGFVFITVILPLILLYLQSKRPKPGQFDFILYQRNKCESPIERRLFNALTFRGFNVRTQERCGPYRIDLALPTYKIAIECDGKAYHSSSEQKKHDNRKNNYLRRNGWSVLRFTGSDINGNITKVIRRIERKVNERSNFV